MFGFEHYGIVPDVVTFSKSLGGGKASIAGYIVRSHIFRRTYGSPQTCAIHSTTFGGMGEECATAIEALNVLVEEGLVENARTLGVHLRQRMEALKGRHPRLVKDVRSVGLLGVIELFPSARILSRRVLGMIPGAEDLLIGLYPAMIVSEMVKGHDILTYTGGREDNVFVNPSLIVTREQIDRFMDALDAVLGQSRTKLALGLLANTVP